MDSFVPHISELWFADERRADDERMVEHRDDDAPSQAQHEALDQLNERINAARSIY